MTLEQFLFAGGLLHFGILIASALVPRVLDWRHALSSLDPLARQLVWVHGAFIVLVIIGFGTISLALPAELCDGSRLSRAVCLFIAIFWAARLAVQLCFFDAAAYFTSWFLKIGYHALTLVFAFHALFYGWAAIAP